MSQYAITNRSTLASYYELTKPNVVLLIVFTAIVGMMLATPGMVPLPALIFGSIGIGLGAASAAVINHLVDQKIDIRMGRTENRPMPTGQVDSIQAGAFALILGSLSMLILVGLVNLMTAALTFASLIGYAFIYTMYLKRATPQNIVIGGITGAAPPVLGWAAVTGEIHPHALLLCLIVFVWTPPHFWALAIAKKHEYEKARLPMLPVTHGVAYTRLHVLLYTILLIPVSLLPFAVKMSGWLYFIGALGLGLVFLYYAIQMMRYPEDDVRLPMKTFGYSIVYLMALFAVLLIDHYIPVLMSFF
ncbi:MAG: heme o synthase [Gammaproteobacteria bacterium]|nr:heme o synthase [Gammaproteobacteria bacterium]